MCMYAVHIYTQYILSTHMHARMHAEGHAYTYIRSMHACMHACTCKRLRSHVVLMPEADSISRPARVALFIDEDFGVDMQIAEHCRQRKRPLPHRRLPPLPLFVPVCAQKILSTIPIENSEFQLAWCGYVSRRCDLTASASCTVSQHWHLCCTAL